jgi:vacuolar-type H+-ATPase subunit F/Vma7
LIYGIGVITGVGFAVLVGARRTKKLLEGREVEMYRALTVRGLERRIDLSDAERAHIDSVYSKHEDTLERILRDNEIDIIPIRSQIGEEIAAKVDPEDRQQVLLFFREVEARRGARYRDPID